MKRGFWIHTFDILLGMVFVLLVAIFVGGNSASVLQYAMKRFGGDLEFTYQSISGNVFDGIEVKAPTYKGHLLAQAVRLKWNPLMLAKNEISIRTLEVKGLEVKKVLAIVKEESATPSNKKNEKTSKKNEEEFEFALKLDTIFIDTTLFVYENISVKNATVNLEKMLYQDSDLSLQKIKVDMESNATDIHLEGEIANKRLHLTQSSINLKNLDSIIAITKSSSPKQTKKSSKKNQISILESLAIDDFIFKMSPWKRGKVYISKANLSAKKIEIDLLSKEIKKANIQIKSELSFGKVDLNLDIRQNRATGELDLSPSNGLYTAYRIPFSPNALPLSHFLIRGDSNGIGFEGDINATKLFKSSIAKSVGANLDTHPLHAIGYFDFDTTLLEINATAEASTRYAKNMKVFNRTVVGDVTRYSGKIVMPPLGLNKNISKLLDHLTLYYEGNETDVKVDINTSQLFAKVVSKDDFDRFDVVLQTPQEIPFAMFTPLPASLQDAKGKLHLSTSIGVDVLEKSIVDVNFSGNLLTLRGDIKPFATNGMQSEMVLEAGELSQSLDKNIAWKSLFPIKMQTSFVNNGITLQLKNTSFGIDSNYNKKDKNLNATLKDPAFIINSKGDLLQTFFLETKVDSIAKLFQRFSNYYMIQTLPFVDGSFEIESKVDKLSDVSVVFKAPQIQYQTTDRIIRVIDDISSSFEFKKNEIVLKEYRFEYGGMEFFSTKPSKIIPKDSTITFSPLWINDTIEVEGVYDISTQRATFHTYATDFMIDHPFAKLQVALDLNEIHYKEDTNIEGQVTLLNGDIYYDINQKHFTPDSDIVVIQEMKKQKKNPFMQTLGLNIKVQNKQPLRYKKTPLDIKADIELWIQKAKFSDVVVLGSIHLLKGGSYRYENKSFIFDDKSYIYFTGDPNNPMLDVTVHYKTHNYLITIKVAGSPQTPIIRFSSAPSLTQEEILSVILFDSEAGAGSHTTEEMMRMMGGAVARSALHTLGITLDHLVIGANNSIEVGKNLTKDVTIIYVNGEIPKVQLMYRHTDTLESVIGASEESSSYDLIYKKDF